MLENRLQLLERLSKIWGDIEMVETRWVHMDNLLPVRYRDEYDLTGKFYYVFNSVGSLVSATAAVRPKNGGTVLYMEI